MRPLHSFVHVRPSSPAERTRTGVLLALALFSACSSPPPDPSTARPAGDSDASARGAAVDELARAQAFVEGRYPRSAVRHSFRTRFGETIDCIDFSAQAGVRALAERGIAVPEPSVSAVRPPAADLLASPGAFDGSRDEDGQERFCEGTTVPQVRIAVEDIERAGGLERFLAVPPKGRAPSDATVTSPPASGPVFAHVWSLNLILPPFDTDYAALSVWTPSLAPTQKGDHSLEQTWTEGNSGQTVEAGWTVAPALNAASNPSSPHLFVYSTSDGYQTGCYNGIVPSNYTNTKTCQPWIALPGTFAPGQTLAASDATTLPPRVVEITVAVTQCSVTGHCPAGWEVQVFSGNTVSNLGYYPASNFTGQFTTSATTFGAGGEVADTTDLNTTTGTNSWTIPMGSGQPASAGYGYAAYVHDYETLAGGVPVGSLSAGRPGSATAPYADAEWTPAYGTVEATWSNFFYLGDGCVAQGCGDLDVGCGPATDRCGNALRCGTCGAGQVCAPTTKACCTPQTTCAPYECGTFSDGCGSEITCPNGCGTNEYCDSSSHTCTVVPLCSPNCPSGYVCESSTGKPPGVCVRPHICPVGTRYCNGKCIPEGAGCP